MFLVCRYLMLNVIGGIFLRFVSNIPLLPHYVECDRRKIPAVCIKYSSFTSLGGVFDCVYATLIKFCLLFNL